MLVAHTDARLGAGGLRATLLLERRFRGNVIERDRLVFDSRWAPPGRRSRAVAHVYAALDGTFEVDGRRVATPCLHVLAEDEFDVAAPGRPRFRSWGAPTRIIELGVRAKDLRVPIGLAHGPVRLPAGAWQTGAALVAAPTPPALHAWLGALAAAGVIAADVAGSVVAVEPEPIARLWGAIRPRYERLETGVSLKALAADAGVSVTTAARHLRSMVHTFGLHGASYRDVIYVMRLRLAAMWLSAPGVTVTQVAAKVGYGGVEAMDRAFANAGLPAPRQVLAEVAYEAVTSGR